LVYAAHAGEDSHFNSSLGHGIYGGLGWHLGLGRGNGRCCGGWGLLGYGITPKDDGQTDNNADTSTDKGQPSPPAAAMIPLYICHRRSLFLLIAQSHSNGDFIGLARDFPLAQMGTK
jgi:hypothetical protein